MLPLLLLALLHLAIGWRLVPDMPGPLAAGLLSALLLASLALMPMAFAGRRGRPQASADRWSWAGMLAIGLFSPLLVGTLAREALRPLLQMAWPGHAAALTAGTAAAVPLLALAFVGWGLLAARRTAAVREVTVPIAGLPAALHGFSIVQISDIHVGPTIKRPYVQAIVDAVNRLQPDAVSITGDLVDGRVADLAHDAAPLAGLRARHGSFFVTGNHDYYSGAPAWIAQLQTLGVQVLINSHRVLQHGGARLVMAGVTDVSAHHFEPSHRSDARQAMAGAPADAALRVLLAHQPRSAPGAEAAGFDVQLSGHTHGGQIWPWNFAVRLQQPFTAGLHRLRRMWVYTSRGTGYWGPPVRVGAPSEITRLRFVAA
jgi:predicted MPP superfamily phosphohydrolase